MVSPSNHRPYHYLTTILPLSSFDKLRINQDGSLYAAGELKLDRVERFKELLALMEENKRKNQYA